MSAEEYLAADRRAYGEVLALDAVTTGICSPQCLICDDGDKSVESCTCVCGGQYHGALSYMSIGQSVEAFDPATFLMCRLCGAKCGNGYVVKGLANTVCRECFTGKGGHWLVGPGCGIDWHDVWDHADRFMHFRGRRQALRLRASGWWRS